WAAEMEKCQQEIINLIVLETGKPLTDAIEEFSRAISHIRSTVNNLQQWLCWQSAEPSQQTRYCAVGNIALITPWNNPVAIPVGKIAPALAFANGVIWKPALPTSRTTMLVLQCLLNTGLPNSLIAVIFGDAQVAKKIIKHPDIDAVSLTGSSQTGALVAKLCGQYNKAFQAELGGNNAAIVMADADIDASAQALAKSAFSFAGQRCTATRRVIVEASVRNRFIEKLLAAVKTIRIGAADNSSTQMGPLITNDQYEKISRIVKQAAQNADCQLLCGGAIPESLQQGYWYLPTVIEADNPESAIVQDETFGPVLVIQMANDFNEAIALCNNVKQGLAASIYTDNIELQQGFIRSAQAGILRINPSNFIIHPDAPFLGWKKSGIGPPEHGQWDREFFSRAQVIYT
ncbi:MAG: aldehyde dehydrogenase, partial [Gammaproteobacteria bacterium]|nr:aldehyde dehydrogenase [Gammaproteobacteria bacterium]